MPADIPPAELHRRRVPVALVAACGSAVIAGQSAWVDAPSEAWYQVSPAAATAVHHPLAGVAAAVAAAGGLLAAGTGWALDSWGRRSLILTAAAGLAVTQSLLLAHRFHVDWEPLSLIAALVTGMVAGGIAAPRRESAAQWFAGRAGQDLLARLSAAPPGILVPDQREASVLTFRLLNETQLRERIPAREFLKFTEALRQTASRLLTSQGALLDAPESGVVRAFFGLPLAVESHAPQAAQAALSLDEVMQEFALTHMRRDHPVAETGIGIASGTLTAGLTGNHYTAAGDAVEQSRWLASLNAEFHTRLLTDEATHLQASCVEDRPLEIMNPPEGAAVAIFQLLGAEGALSIEALQRRDAFRDAIVLLRAGHAADALARFADAREGLIHEDAVLERFVAEAEAQSARDGIKPPLRKAPLPRPSARKSPRL